MAAAEQDPELTELFAERRRRHGSVPGQRAATDTPPPPGTPPAHGTAAGGTADGATRGGRPPGGTTGAARATTV